MIGQQKSNKTQVLHNETVPLPSMPGSRSNRERLPLTAIDSSFDIALAEINESQNVKPRMTSQNGLVSRVNSSKIRSSNPKFKSQHGPELTQF